MSTTTRTEDPQTADEKWAAQIEGLRNRKPAEAFLTIPDTNSLVAVAQARNAYLQARNEARGRVPDAGALSTAEIDAFVEDDTTVKGLYEALESAVDVAQDAEVTFHFRALPPDVYDALKLAHPATEEQALANYAWNPDTFFPALVAACSVKPITVQAVHDLAHPDVDDDGTVTREAFFNEGDVGAIMQTCRDLNERPRLILGKGSRPTPG